VTDSLRERLGLPRVRAGGSFFARLALSALLLGALAAWLPLDELAAAIRRTGLALWAALLAGLAAGHLVSAAKWRVLLAASGLRPRWRDVWAAHGLGLFANLWLPSLVGGDVVRAAHLARRDGGLARLAAAGLADRVLDTAALVTLALAGLAAAPATRGFAARPVAAAALLGLASAAAGLALLLRLPAARLGPRLETPLLRLRAAAESILARPRAALAAFALSLAVQAGFVALNVRLAAAVGIHLPAATWYLVWPLAKLVALAPISLGGLGVREAAQAALLAPLGVPAALAVAQSLVWQSLLLALGLAAAGAVAAAARAQPPRAARSATATSSSAAASTGSSQAPPRSSR
jgi:uncharacterized membrane protein YbhN (UPF0104 family)